MTFVAVCVLLVVAALPGGERERGLQLYREGRFAEAAAAFRAAIAQDGDSPELQWNLALASWRANELAAAETAVEKYAAATKHARVDLHAGLLGAIRHGEADALVAQADAAAAPPPAASPQPGAAPPGTEGADPLPLLEQALTKATQARDHFVRGAATAPTPELTRNVERALRTIEQLQARIDELKQQREQQQQDPGDDKDQKQQPDDKSDEKQPQPDQQQKEKQKGEQPDEQHGEQQQPKPDEKPGEQHPDEKPSDPKQQQGEGNEPPEPKQAPEPKPQPKQGEGDRKQGAPDGSDTSKPEPDSQPQPDATEPGKPRDDAPGERAEGRLLSPEQTQRLLEQLQQLDDKQKALRARLKSGRKRVERDW
jgi:tetratricopeptide (TPR) repeat protein